MSKRTRPGDPLVAIAYVRVSTEDQNLGESAQLAAVEAWAKRSGVTIAAVFEDHGVSGASPIAERPGLVAALAAIRERGAGALVAAKRDRFARDVVVSGLLERTAGAAGATIRTADGASDATGAEGSLMRGIVDVFAAYERDVIRARTRAALSVKKTRGERVSGGIPFGFALAADGVHLVAVESEQATIGAARALAAAGLSLRAVAAGLAARGHASRKGKPFAAVQIARMLEAARLAG